MAVKRLREKGYNVKAIGLREGQIDDVTIEIGKPDYKDIDTVLMYINPERQPDYYNYITSLNPRRIIFNPGTENSEFQSLASEKGIEPIEACSLIMLSTGLF